MSGAIEELDDPREFFLDHYRSPRNRYKLEDCDGMGSMVSANGAMVTISLKLDRLSGEDARIARIGFQSHRCGITVAYASLLTELVLGRSLTQVSQIRPEDLMSRFGKGANARDSAALVIGTLRRALDNIVCHSNSAARLD